MNNEVPSQRLHIYIKVAQEKELQEQQIHKKENYSNKSSWGVTENEPYCLLCGVYKYLHLVRGIHTYYKWSRIGLGTLICLLGARLTSTDASATENFLCCC